MKYVVLFPAGFGKSLIFLVVFLLAVDSQHVFSQSKLCTGILGDPIISNDFGSGTPVYNTGKLDFSTTFSLWNKAKTDDGRYSIVNRIPNDFQLQNQNVWLTGNDHTSNDGRGYMMLVNADEKLGEFYRDTVTNLCLGGTYEFSAYLANIFKIANSFPTPVTSIPPKVRFEIREVTGKLLDTISSGNIVNTATLAWQKYGITFTAPSTSIVLVMVSTASRGTGNDIVLDDIAFRPCTPATISITPTISVCENGSGTFTVNIKGNADYKFSRWQQRRAAGTWNYIGSVLSQTTNSQDYNVDLPLTGIPVTDDNTQYRLILSTNSSNLSDVNSVCNVTSPVSLLRVHAIPVLRITDPAPSCGKPINLTAPALTTGSSLAGAALSYFGSQSDAFAAVNPLANMQAAAITLSGTYYIRAATATNPVCSNIQPVKIVIEEARTLTVAAPAALCKDLPDFTAIATVTRIGNLVWSKHSVSNAVSLQTGSATFLQVQPTAIDLKEDSIWIKVRSDDPVTVCPNLRDSVKVLFYRPAEIVLPKDTALCIGPSGMSLSVRAVSSNSPASVTWQSTGIAPSPLSGNTVRVFLTGAESIFELVATASKQGCLPRRDTMKIHYAPLPLANAGPDTAFCLGPEFFRQILLQPGTRALWGITVDNVLQNAVSLTNQLRFTPVKNSLISLTTINSLGCEATDDFLISAIPSPTVSLPEHVCLDSGVNSLSPLFSQIPASGTFTWLKDNQVVNSASAVSDLPVSGPGLYTIRYALNACTASDSTRITLPPVLTLGNETACAGKNVVFSVPAIPKASYFWNGSSIASGPAFSAMTASSTIPTVVRVQVTDSLGCEGMASATLTAIVLPGVSLPDHVCLESTTQLLPVIQPVPVSGKFAWSVNKKTIHTSATVSSWQPTERGLYRFSYSDKDCTTSDSVLVTLPPVATLSSQEACLGASVLFTAAQIPKMRYSWNGGLPGNLASFKTFATSSPVTIALQVTDSLGCHDTASAQLRSIAFPDFRLTAENVCPGETGTIRAALVNAPMPAGNNFLFQWKKDNIHVESTGWEKLSFTQAGNYSLTLSARNCEVTKNQQGSIYPVPEIQPLENLTYCNEDKVPLNLRFKHNGTKQYWYEGSTLLGTSAQLSVLPDSSTRYSLISENADGCRSSASVLVSICCAPSLHVPNVITPASQDVNATFGIFGKYFTAFELTVFSRWGEIVYATNEHKMPWDGRYKNENAPIGEYAWLITYEGLCPQFKGPYKKTGDVTVIR